jgi:hypothetical protein
LLQLDEYSSFNFPGLSMVNLWSEQKGGEQIHLGDTIDLAAGESKTLYVSGAWPGFGYFNCPTGEYFPLAPTVRSPRFMVLPVGKPNPHRLQTELLLVAVYWVPTRDFGKNDLVIDVRGVSPKANGKRALVKITGLGTVACGYLKLRQHVIVKDHCVQAQFRIPIEEKSVLVNQVLAFRDDYVASIDGVGRTLRLSCWSIWSKDGDYENYKDYARDKAVGTAMEYIKEKIEDRFLDEAADALDERVFD